MWLAASLLFWIATSHLQAQPVYAINWSSAGGGIGVSTGAVYSASRAVGSGDSPLLVSAHFAVSGNTSSGSILVPGFPSSAFYVGLDLHDPAQALADYDSDGLSNLMEFGLGTDPKSPVDASQVFQIHATSGTTQQFLTMNFKRRHNAATLGLQYLPEVSADGQTWYADSTHVIEIDSTALDSEFDWVTVQDSTPEDASSPRFFRLRIVQN